MTKLSQLYMRITEDKASNLAPLVDKITKAKWC